MNKEQQIIKRFFSPLANNKESLGLKNDAAILFQQKKMIVSSDMMIEGKHFDKSYDPKILAMKLLRINLSDVAAMGGDPYGYLLNIGLPKKKCTVWLKRFCEGLNTDMKKYKIKLFGGDLTSSPLIFLSATIFGFIKDNFLLNKKLTQDSQIFVSGNLGDAAIGLKIKNNKIKKYPANSKEYFLKKLYLPDPKIKIGKSLVGIVDFCTDISDGISGELSKMINDTKLQANIFLSDIPISDHTKKLIEDSSKKKKIWDLIVNGGEDYQLLFSVKPENINALKNKKIKNIKRIGFLEKGSGVKFYDREKKKINLSKTGYSHF